MRCSDYLKANSGFTVLEALVTLSVLALTAAMFSGRNPEPSSELRFASLIGELKRDVATARAQAVVERQLVTFNIQQERCDDLVSPIVFFPDGTVSASEICLAIGEYQRLLTIHPITGQVQMASQA